MKIRSGNHVRLAGFCGHRWRTAVAAVAVCCAGLLAIGVLLSTPCRAASIPAWLDDSISKWNEENPGVTIRFDAIKDPFVWYIITRTPEHGQQEIRAAIKSLAIRNNYVPMKDEDTVTTGNPPVASGESTPKKCWSRSFVKSSQTGTPGQTRMLTTLVCEDAKNWWAAFRIAD